MSGNTFGKIFTLTTFGESHGLALGGVIDGCPPGLNINEQLIQQQLDRRKPGQNKYTSQRREDDKIKILSGIYQGKTTGTPIAFIIENIDQKPKDYQDIANKFRPGHADYTYFAKYGHRDPRGGGRASARETAARVAGAAIAKQYLKLHNIEIYACISQIGDLKLTLPKTQDQWLQASNNKYFCASQDDFQKIEEIITKTRNNKNSIGAKISVAAFGVPAGLGNPVFDKLDANIAKALMGINAVKAVEIGEGIGCLAQAGSEHADQMSKEQGFLSNNAGGILGGISSGEVILAHCTFKPTSSIATLAKTISESGENTDIITKGRHDPCVGLRAAPIVEAMLALTLVDHMMLDLAQNHLVDRTQIPLKINTHI